MVNKPKAGNMKHTIKKYNNRKLYSTLENRHITLDYIKDLVQQGRDLEVIDNKTGANITQAVMLKAYTESLSPDSFTYDELKGKLMSIDYPLI